MVEMFRFTFWEGLKVGGLVLFAVLAVRTIAAIFSVKDPSQPGMISLIQTALYGLIVLLALAGAWGAGHNISAEFSWFESQKDLERGDIKMAFLRASRAVQVRPGNIIYWRQLEKLKQALGQSESQLGDLPAFEQLSPGGLEENDQYVFAVAYFLAGRYDPALHLTSVLIRANPSFASPYILQAFILMHKRDYADAIGTLHLLLRSEPGNETAVAALAHAYFLQGNRAAVLATLDETLKVPFPLEARKHFEELKELYGQ
jgi:tetratricopeptide (TPR) repeat protein